jgi:thymidylate synthase (FAD)
MTELRVKIIASSRFNPVAASEATDWQWDDTSEDAAALTEFAGRACYASWAKPNPLTATNEGYIAHIQEVGHWSVLEHGFASIYIQGVSRSLTHELIRHRHFSPSQLSQRFVVLKADVAERSTDDFVVPPLFDGDAEAADLLLAAWENAVESYGALLVRAETMLTNRGVTGTSAKKQAREAARAVLPNMTPTAIVLSGNHRAWREMLLKRLQPQADAEISRLARLIFNLLSTLEPTLYQDLELSYPIIDNRLYESLQVKS